MSAFVCPDPYVQLKQANPGDGAVAVERFDRFPRMLQDKEKFALLRAIERCPEPDNVAVRGWRHTLRVAWCDF